MLNKKVLTIDLGTSAVRAALTVKEGEERKTFIASVPPRGIKSGTIINPSSATDSLQSAINKLKLESPYSLPPEAYVLITAGYTLSYKVETKITFPGWQTISYSDVNEIKNKAEKELLKKLGHSVKQHYEVIHIIPQEFTVENLTGIQNPIGHSGRELGMKAFVILASKSQIKNVEALLNSVKLKFKGVILQSLAAYYGVRDEKSYFNNNLLIHIGGGNTEYLYFRDDKPIYARHVPFGAEDILEALTTFFKISRKEAERIFMEHGSAHVKKVSKEEIVNVNYGTDVKKLPKLYITAIIHYKLRTLLKDIKRDLEEKDPTFVSNLNRVYLTGGLSKLKDFNYLCSRIFKTPTFVLETKDATFKEPEFATIVGAANYIFSLKNKKKLSDIKEDLTKEFGKQGLFGRILNLISEII